MSSIPLHNNVMELAVRRWVREQDASFSTQSRTGERAWDTFQTVAAMAAKLGAGFSHYLHNCMVTLETILP